MEIDQKRIDKIFEDLKKIYLEKFVSGVEIFGEENLSILKDEQALYLPNHVSHFDYVVIPYILNMNGLMHPIIVAGSNLDHWPANKILQKETGAFFIDRKILKKKEVTQKKKEEILKINFGLEKIVKEGQNFMNFIESGRSYDGSVMERGDTGILKRYLKKVKEFGKEPYGCNIAIRYEPHTIEKKCLKFASFFKNKVEPIYFFSDIYAFIKNYFSKKDKKPLVKINFGKPYTLKEFMVPKGEEELLKFVKRDVKRLHLEIS